MRQREHGERERLQRRQRLRPHENACADPAIDEHAGERRENERRDLSPEADDAEQQRRSGQSIDEPARRDARDPRSDERDALAAEEESKVAMGERAGDARARGVGRHDALFRTLPAIRFSDYFLAQCGPVVHAFTSNNDAGSSIPVFQSEYSSV